MHSLVSLSELFPLAYPYDFSSSTWLLVSEANLCFFTEPSCSLYFSYAERTDLNKSFHSKQDNKSTGTLLSC